MKNIKFLVLFFILPLLSNSQELTGIWTGSLSNDSTTIRKDQTFEIALTEYRGKVYGYAYSTFIVNDTLFFIIKRVKGDVNGKICEVKDDEVVTHNFRRSPDKDVSVVYTFRHDQPENEWVIDGNWRTNRTKEYYSISGDVNASAERDLSKSKLYEHLGDLNLQSTLAVNKPPKSTSEKKIPKEKKVKEDIVKTRASKEKPPKESDKQNTNSDVARKERTASNKNSTADILKTETKKEIVKAGQKTKEKEPATDIAKKDTKKPETISDVVRAEQKQIESKPVADIVKTEAGKLEEKKDAAIVVEKTGENKRVNDIATIDVKRQDTKSNSPEFVFEDLKRTERKLKLAAAMVNERISVPSETIYFRSDSLVLSLYDNGEIDGDTVSVILNGVLIIEKQLLKSAAFKKTIYFTPDDADSVLLVLYADNLGIYPPNTGLLIIEDGEQDHYVRFKADFDRNAAILLRRKL